MVRTRDAPPADPGRSAGNRVARFLAALPDPAPSELFAAMVRQWTEEYETDGFDRGCPVVAATVDCAESVSTVAGELVPVLDAAVRTNG